MNIQLNQSVCSFNSWHFIRNCIFPENDAVLYVEPFSCCILPNFVKDDHFLQGLKDELLGQIFIEKNNDLYKFQQVKNRNFPMFTLRWSVF